MSEDRELETWREEWGGVPEPPAGFQLSIQQRIKHQERRFVLGNFLTGCVFLGMLILALFLRHRLERMGSGWSTGLCILVFVSAGFRVWVLRRTWRPQTQSISAFVELWHRRMAAQIRLLRISIYLSLGWMILCALLTAANWTIIGRDVRAHPKEWVELLVACVLMQPVLWYGAAWFRRRKLAELHEVKKILDEMDGKNEKVHRKVGSD